MNKTPSAAEVVPGAMHCAKCKFRLYRTNLYVGNGTTGPGDNKTEPCPNGCGPLWPVSWKQESEELGERLEEAWKEIEGLKGTLKYIATQAALNHPGALRVIQINAETALSGGTK